VSYFRKVFALATVSSRGPLRRMTAKRHRRPAPRRPRFRQHRRMAHRLHRTEAGTISSMKAVTASRFQILDLSVHRRRGFSIPQPFVRSRQRHADVPAAAFAATGRARAIHGPNAIR